MSLTRIIELWNENMEVAWWEMLLIGSALLLVNFGIFWGMWLMRREVIYEYGFPKRNRKYIKKLTARYSLLERLLLVKLSSAAQRKGAMLHINIFCHFVHILAFCLSCLGFVGAMCTLADGWAMTLLALPQISALFVSTIIEIIPRYLFLSSERRAYRFFK